jgi:hypothetical protein
MMIDDTTARQACVCNARTNLSLRQLAEVVVAQRRLDELALGVQDARVARVVLQLQRLVLAVRQQEAGFLDERVRVQRVVVLQVQLRDLDALAQLVRRIQLALPAVQLDAGQHLRGLRPGLLSLVHGGHGLADDGHLGAGESGKEREEKTELCVRALCRVWRA